MVTFTLLSKELKNKCVPPYVGEHKYYNLLFLTFFMGKRLENLPLMGQVIADEVAYLGISVRALCATAHISKKSYYNLLKGNDNPLRYTAGSCAV